MTADDDAKPEKKQLPARTMVQWAQPDASSPASPAPSPAPTPGTVQGVGPAKALETAATQAMPPPSEVAQPPGTVRYQLLHRAASAIITGEQYRAAAAVLLVHSFSQERAGWPDYQSFTRLFGVEAAEGVVQRLGSRSGVALFGVWVVGEESFLRK